MLACAAVAFACGPRRPAVPAAEPELIVLLADDGGAVGRVSVANQLGATDLDDAREATRVVPGRAPGRAVVLDESDVAKIFGDALAGLPGAPQSFVLYFRLESNDLTDESRARLPEVLKAIASRAVPEVVAIGHTDTTGDRQSNLTLGLSRANAVRDLLVKTGIEKSLIEVVSHGEADLLILTGDEVFEPRNRRVEITVR
jgi:outer membrane protein OmpA-like peptidoglycan-associated protein